MYFDDHIIILYLKLNVIWRPHNYTVSEVKCNLETTYLYCMEGKCNFVDDIILLYRKVNLIWRPNNFTASEGKYNYACCLEDSL